MNDYLAGPMVIMAPCDDMRILVVEDNLVNQKVIIMQLQRLGCGADVAANGQEALNMLAQHAYALVLMDCNMPVMDGYEATRSIRRAEAGTGRHLPIVAVTANALVGDREKCLDAGMDDYLPKPVKLDALRQALACWLPMVGQRDLAALASSEGDRRERLA